MPWHDDLNPTHKHEDELPALLDGSGFGTYNLHLEIECERKGVFYNYGRLMPLKKANKASMNSRRIISLDFIDMFIKDTSHEVKFTIS
jgi:hypothetical protein